MSYNPIFISYHTGSPYYSSTAEKLVSKINFLGGRIKMEKLQDTGHYWKNTLIKPQFVLDKLKELKTDLIWIDADTDLIEYTECMKNWSTDIIAASHTGDLYGIKASPLGVKYNQRTLSFFESFSERCNNKIANNEIDLDHDVLKYEILPSFVGKLSIEILTCNGSPVDYTDGKYIKNGISRGMNKGNETRLVMDKNERRNKEFNSLSLENFK